MAELDVQPRRRTSNSFLPWLLLALGVIALIYFITRRGDRKADEARTVADDVETTTHSTTSENAARSEWDAVDFYNVPRAPYDEIKSGDVEMNGNKEVDLFDDGKTSFKRDADQRLSEVVQSINSHFKSGEVRLYGHSHTQNDNIGEVRNQRMELLRNWLSQNGLINISIHL